MKPLELLAAGAGILLLILCSCSPPPAYRYAAIEGSDATLESPAGANDSQRIPGPSGVLDPALDGRDTQRAGRAADRGAAESRTVYDNEERVGIDGLWADGPRPVDPNLQIPRRSPTSPGRNESSPGNPNGTTGRPLTP